VLTDYLIRFNADTGSNYAWRRNNDGAGDHMFNKSNNFNRPLTVY
jgi:hypothetical protein